MSKFTVLELFAGAGGMALGFERAGLESVALVEIDKDACATLRKNRPEWNVLHQDVSEVDFTKFDVDVVTGGFPVKPLVTLAKDLGSRIPEERCFSNLQEQLRKQNQRYLLVRTLRV